MSPKSATGTDTEVVEAPVEEAAAEETAPVQRYFSTSIDIFAYGDDARPTSEAVEAAVKEQVILPTWLDIAGVKLQVTGANVTGSSEGTDAPEIEAGFGREASPPKAE